MADNIKSAPLCRTCRFYFLFRSECWRPLSQRTSMISGYLDDLLKEDAESERAGHRKGVLFKRDACGPSGRFFEPKRQAGLDLTRQERADG